MILDTEFERDDANEYEGNDEEYEENVEGNEENEENDREEVEILLTGEAQHSNDNHAMDD
jgi:hypothetical protein